MSKDKLAFLRKLEDIIAERSQADASESYTATLIEKGPAYIAQKVGEEAVELVIAGVQPERDRITAEAADLIYHLLVLLQARDLQLADVVRELESRHR